MPLIKLDVFSLRNLDAVSFTPSPGLNFLIGANASGKSSLLEAIFILSRSRSFRTTQLKQAIQFNAEELIVSGLKQQGAGSLSTLGIRASHKDLTIRIDQMPKQRADLAYALPVQLVQPKSYQLLDAGPQNRREFLDWGIFNQHPRFLFNWRCFSKALQQRNAVLKMRQRGQLTVWDQQLADYGQVVNEYRQRYLEELQPFFLKLAAYFLECDDIELRFHPGWDQKQALLSILAEDVDRDLKYGFTHSGPHRADFSTYHNHRLAKDYLSRGQQKLLMLSLMLAQVALLNQHHPNQCLILIDDPSAELDSANKAKLLKYLNDLGCQVFITATSLDDFGDVSSLDHYQVFHVKHGQIEKR